MVAGLLLYLAGGRWLPPDNRPSERGAAANLGLMAAGIDRVYVNGTLSFRAADGVVARAGRLTGGNNA